MLEVGLIQLRTKDPWKRAEREEERENQSCPCSKWEHLAKERRINNVYR